MFKREVDSFKRMIIPANNQRYLSTPKKNYEKFGKTIERSSDNPFITPDGQYIDDFFALFEKGKPDILFSEKLMQLGEWQDYGSKLYRLNTTYSVEEVKALLVSELEINPKEVLVTTSISGHFHRSS
ncbi:hypothetical protein I6N96_03965 [Enterococcus sp. BWM-S5]|uniref:Uncharacterized protein n=1 Tax=Enterococcus larvae TaxID=2794352 RepID=A0ABS4CFL1_9ENTE|nr:hypothetical protein [Enterococcus larvae]MBP1045421.1 hypothetical protein [Enterococcus larvae]